MFLLKQLQALKEEAERNASREDVDISKRAIIGVLESGLLDKVIQVGERMPDFALPDGQNQVTRLADFLLDGPLVINFYRGIWCPFCNLELEALNEFLPEFAKHSAKLVAISPQRPKFNLEVVSRHGLNYTVLSDAGNRVAQSIGLAYPLADDLRKLYLKGGTDLAEYNGGDSWTLPMPARLIVDRNSIVRYVRVNADYTNRPEPEETLAVLAEIAGRS